MAKISVIVPIYNSSSTLSRCIESILNQTFYDFELILVNDGSLDNSLNICESYESDKRVIIIDKKNNGVSEARNDGIRKSTADYLLFVDSDDYLEKNALDIVYKDKEYDCVIYGYNILLCNNQKISICTQNRKFDNFALFGNSFTELYCKNIINSSWNKLYKKKLIKDYFPRELNMGEDLIFNLKYMNNCSTIAIIDDCLYNYVIENSNSLSKKYSDDLFKNALNFYQEILKFCTANFANNYNLTNINNKLVEDCFAIIQKLIYSGKYTRKKTINKIKEISSNSVVIDCFKKTALQNIQYNFFAQLILRKKYFLIYLIFSLKKWIKGVK